MSRNIIIRDVDNRESKLEMSAYLEYTINKLSGYGFTLLNVINHPTDNKKIRCIFISEILNEKGNI